ncbi:unnamed protein product [Merluccius merluccius]
MSPSHGSASRGPGLCSAVAAAAASPPLILSGFISAAECSAVLEDSEVLGENAACADTAAPLDQRKSAATEKLFDSDDDDDANAAPLRNVVKPEASLNGSGFADSRIKIQRLHL